MFLYVEGGNMFGVGMGVCAISLYKAGEWRREEVGFGGGTGETKREIIAGGREGEK